MTDLEVIKELEFLRELNKENGIGYSNWVNSRFDTALKRAIDLVILEVSSDNVNIKIKVKPIRSFRGVGFEFLEYKTYIVLRLGSLFIVKGESGEMFYFNEEEFFSKFDIVGYIEDKNEI